MLCSVGVDDGFGWHYGGMVDDGRLTEMDVRTSKQVFEVQN